MRFTGHGCAFQAFAHGAVRAGNRHRTDELGRVRASPGRLQQRAHFPGADPFGARQAGAVLHDQMRRSDAFLHQPLANYALGGFGVICVGIVAVLGAEAEEQLLGHGVVTVFVDVADDLGQIRRERPGQNLGIFRHGGQTILALNAAAQFLPNRPHGTGGVGRVVEQRQVGLRTAAVAQLAVDCHAHAAVGPGYRVVAHVTGALLGVDGFDLIVDLNAGDWRLDGNQYLARVIASDKAQRLEVDHQ